MGSIGGSLSIERWNARTKILEVHESALTWVGTPRALLDEATGGRGESRATAAHRLSSDFDCGDWSECLPTWSGGGVVS